MKTANNSRVLRTIPFIFIVVLFCPLAHGNVIHVDDDGQTDFDNIQAGIDAANDADTVLVAPGEYVTTEPITFRGKAITVKSEAGPDETTIRMSTPVDPNRGSVVVFDNNETAESVLEGFTLTGGRGSRVYSSSSTSLVGGGILFDASFGTVKNCAIVQNAAKHGGGILGAYGASPSLTGCTIIGNSATEFGGGVFCYINSSMNMADCIISGNSVTGVTIGGAGYGGGLVCMDTSSLTLTNCNIADNSAGVGGAGLFCVSKSLMNLTNCDITENSAATIGGGMFCEQDSSVTMTDCIINGNSAGRWGGGIECYLNSSLTMTNCKVISNTSQRQGGGVESSDGSSVTLTNCLIVRNSAAEWGGGLSCDKAAAFMTVYNCTIWGNSAGQTGGAVGCANGASATVTNSIIWGNTAPVGREISLASGSTLGITYSDITGGRTGVNVAGSCTLNWSEGNIDADPLYIELSYCVDINDPNLIVRPDNPNAVWTDGDYHLKSEAGHWTSANLVESDPNNDSWVLDDVTSPCIDRGDPNSPVGDEPMPNGGIINMGAYGDTREASMSTGLQQPLPPPPSLAPLAHWKLDEAEGNIAFNSTSYNYGILSGNPTWQLDSGLVAGALEFDGIDDYISTDFVLDPSLGTFSVFVWVKGGAPGQVIISQSTGAGNIWLGLDAPGGNLMTGLVPPSVGWVAKKPLVSESIISDSQWHHIGFVWDGSYRILYADGIEVAKDAAAQNPLKSATGGLYIGAGKTLGAGTFFSGLIDDVRIYNKALTAEDIDALIQ